MQVTAGNYRDDVRAVPDGVSFAMNTKDVATGLRWGW